MPNDDAKLDPDIIVTDELDPADVAVITPEDLRRARIGSRVLAMAEEEGRRRGCSRIALTTLSVEAPGFYQKQGYDIAATIDCDPPGLTRHYMMKRLVPLRG
jgi:GNAT superfamily N-acetyltransferase